MGQSNKLSGGGTQGIDLIGQISSVSKCMLGRRYYRENWKWTPKSGSTKLHYLSGYTPVKRCHDQEYSPQCLIPSHASGGIHAS
jgi:hypothetical protein